MAKSAQMNFRIDAAMKSAGDLALGESGVKASELVRLTWEYLARNRHVTDAVTKLVRFLKSDGTIEERAEQGCRTQDSVKAGENSAELVVMAGPNIIRQFYENAGINPDEVVSRPYDEMKRDAYACKFPELV